MGGGVTDRGEGECHSHPRPHSHNPHWLKMALWSVTGMNVISGTVSGVAGVLAGHPFDTVKVRLQSQPHSLSAPPYRGTLHCFLSIAREEGIRGLFRGVSSPLVGVTAINTLLFGVYGFFLDCQVRAGACPTLTQIFIAGAGSGLVNSLISGPVELAKIQMQNQRGRGQGSFRSPSHCLRLVYRTAGLIGVYRGFLATILRETPSYGVYFACFEWLRRQGETPQNGGHLENSKLMLAGGLSGIAGWMSTYPMDVIKTRIQAQSLIPGYPTKTPACTGIVDGWRQIVKSEGVPGLFRGTTATIIRAFPTNAVIFTTYALTMRWLDQCNPLNTT